MDLVPRFDRARNPHVGFVTLRPWLSDMSQLGRLPVDSLRAWLWHASVCRTEARPILLLT